jgi:hypothetical protein
VLRALGAETIGVTLPARILRGGRIVGLCVTPTRRAKPKLEPVRRAG